jgi:hypothetical protein
MMDINITPGLLTYGIYSDSIEGMSRENIIPLHHEPVDPPLEWVAAWRFVEAALIEYSGTLSQADKVALFNAWKRIEQG